MDNKLQITLFGAPQILLCGEPVKGFITSKAEALFYYLAATDCAHTRTALARLFWPNVVESQAKKNLRDVLPNLRHLLGDYLLVTREEIAFNRETNYWLDVEEFCTKMKPLPHRDGLDLSEGVKLYQGDFLDGFYVHDAPGFEEWVFRQREQFQTCYIKALAILVDAYLADQNYEEGLNLTRRWLAVEPWDEQAHRLQMQLFAFTGQRRSALVQFETCRQLLMRDLSVEPDAQTVALYEQIRQGEIAEIKKQNAERQGMREKTKTAQPSHPFQALPSRSNWDAEIAYFETRILNPAYPLITLVGEGVQKKTELALAIAEKVRKCFVDGICFVPLPQLLPSASLHEQLATILSRSLNFPINLTTPVKPQLFEQLRHQTLLLVLTTSEPMSFAAEFIFELLQATQNLKILAISHQRLSLYGEYVCCVKSLTLSEEMPTLPIEHSYGNSQAQKTTRLPALPIDLIKSH